MLGIVLGHLGDRALGGLPSPSFTRISTNDLQRIKSEFFTATFSVMGYVAKFSGRLTESDASLATNVMDRMGLPTDRRKIAINLFNKGKLSDFSLHNVVNQFFLDCRDQPKLLEMFIEIQLYAAFADGKLTLEEKQIIQNVTYQLGFSAADYARLEATIRAEYRMGQDAATGNKKSKQQSSTGKQQKSGSSSYKQGSAGSRIDDAYAILNMSQNASDEDIKMAYRRLTSQHHPDKLIAKGLPEEMMKIAEIKTHEIREAYERIREVRNF